MIGNHTLTGGEAKLLRFKFDKSWIFKYFGQFWGEETICTKAFLVPLLCRCSGSKKHFYFNGLDFESDKRQETGVEAEMVTWGFLLSISLVETPIFSLWRTFNTTNISQLFMRWWCLVALTGQTDSQVPQLSIYLFLFGQNKTLLIINSSNYKDHLTPQPADHICFYY